MLIGKSSRSEKSVEYIIYRDLKNNKSIVKRKDGIYIYNKLAQKKYTKLIIKENYGCDIYIPERGIYYECSYINMNNKFVYIRRWGIFYDKIKYFYEDDFIKYIVKNKLYKLKFNKYEYTSGNRFYVNPYSVTNLTIDIFYKKEKFDHNKLVIVYTNSLTNNLYEIYCDYIERKAKTSIQFEIKEKMILSTEEELSKDMIELLKNKINEIEGTKVFDIIEHK